MTPGPNSSAQLLINLLRGRAPFFFVRIGDGAIECITGKRGVTCDAEAYHPELAKAMAEAIVKLRRGGDGVLWGDWRTAVAGSAPNYVDQWGKLVDVANRRLINYEALLLMRLSPSLLDFYDCVKSDPRRKLYIGSHYHTGAPGMLNSWFLPMRGGGVFHQRQEIVNYMERYKPEVVLFGAGMGGLISVVDYWSQRANTPDEPTCIHLGSALDPLFQRPTRARQLPTVEARQFFKELL